MRLTIKLTADDLHVKTETFWFGHALRRPANAKLAKEIFKAVTGVVRKIKKEMKEDE